ncbi:hypothetical protein J4436_04520 [Candidatus Woesearchaeota archaeon]|nr:hypothetical protein [Candidatus Woesearchaeota archaeon]
MMAYIMSIKKDYGLNLLEHKSLWEYGRRKSRINIGDRIILYATAPDNKLIGEFIVGVLTKFGKKQRVMSAIRKMKLCLI